MTKRKLERFAEMETFPNVIQPKFEDVFQKPHTLKGKWKKEIFKNNNSIILELGCGKGEYSIGLARIFHDSNFIGVDIKGSRMWRGAKTAISENINNVRFLRTRIELIGSFFDSNEVDEIWLTFPDPQPKKAMKRLSSSRFLNLYRNFLKPGGRIHLKTDNPGLYHYTYTLAVENKFLIEIATKDLYREINDDPILDIRTFYERKFLAEGLPIHYLKFELNNNKEVIEPSDDEW